MKTLLFKEVKYFFISPIAYIVLGIYWSFNSFIFIVLKNDFNLFQNKFIDFTSFFYLTPWFMFFLIPALTMNSYSQEIRSGTFEIIITKPISYIEIIISKFLAYSLLFILSVLPTVIYIIYVSTFSISNYEIEANVIIGSYLGLFLLGSNFISICLTISIIFKNQINNFIIGFLICFSQFFLFDQIALYSNSDNLYNFILNIGSKSHYENFINGVIPIKDVGYFIGIDFFLLSLSLYLINKSLNE